jgi:hypothetical protein
MKDFEMTQEQLDILKKNMKSVPMIALQCGQGRSRQEIANDAWNRLGKEMGFNHHTVRPNGKGDRFFTAESTSCEGISLGDGNFSGCDQSGGDCPECGK